MSIEVGITSEGTALDPILSQEQGGRFHHLILAVEAARRKRTERDVRKLLQFVGMLAVGAGFLCIGLGWYGAAHSGYQYEEIPFLISGGVFGIGLVVTGSALIHAAWSLRHIEEVRRAAQVSHQDALEILSGLESLRAQLKGRTTGSSWTTGGPPGEEKQ